MTNRPKNFPSNFYPRLIRVIGVIVPRRLRADWRQEWEAELRVREETLAEWDKLDRRNKIAMLWHSLGALMDALWLQPRRWEDEMIQDLRYGARMLKRNPGFTLVAIITLALGIGANTAIFSVVNGVLLKPLPYPEPERLARVFMSFGDFQMAAMSPASFDEYRRLNSSFESFAGYMRQDMQLAQEEGAERLPGMRVSSGFFRTLGYQPMLGREFTLEEEIPDESAVVILSHGLWRRRFDSDPNIVGKTIRLSGKSYTVVGVAPAGLRHVGGGYRPLPHGESVDIWWPQRRGPSWRRNAHVVNIIGRLKPGVTLAQADVELNLIATRLAAQSTGAFPNIRIQTQPLHEEIVAESKMTLLLLQGAIFFVLLIACVNVANLTLARAIAREREFAVRAALGAGRARVIRQLLVESLTLASFGASLGLLLARLAIHALVKLGPEQLPRLEMIESVGLDGRMLAFTISITVLTGLLFGLPLAFQISKLNLNESLKEGGRASSGGKGQRRLRSALAVAEVALALTLLIGAGLLMRSFVKLRQIDPGFDPSNTLTMNIAVYKGAEEQISFYQQLLDRISGLPGVRSAGVTSDLPWTDYENETTFRPEGKPVIEDRLQRASYHFISADYMKTIGVPLMSGRWFDARDTRKSPQVILINQAMARRYWQGEDVIGKRITFSKNPQKDEDWLRVVGVIGDVKDYPNSVEAEPAIYWCLTQEPYPEMKLAIRADTNPLSLAQAVRREVLALDREIPVAEVRTLDTVAAAALANQRFTLLLVGLFALTALVLAAIGIYGVVSYLVANQTHEIGIRIALGATVSDIMKFALRLGAQPTLIGVLIGTFVSLALTRLMKSLLFGVSAADPLTYALIAALLLAVGLLACYIPARRATKVDPMVALRQS